MKKENLSLKEIFLKDERFRISYYFCLEKLVLSLKKVGLISPPIVTFRGERCILVSGWKRVLACLKISLSPLPVFVIEEENDLKTFLTAFYENLATRKFSLLEKAEILTKLKKFGEEEKKIVRFYMPLLKIPSTLSLFDSYLIFSQLEPEVKKVIHEKNMSFPSVELLAGFTPQERKLLLPLILPLSQNKRKKTLEDLQEISKKNDVSAEKILKTKEILNILGTKRLSPLQKADNIRLLLKKKRYPTLSTWTDSFNSLLKRLQWPREIEINPSPFFEEENFFVKFTFKDQKELRASLHKLQELSSREELSEIFKFK